MLTRGVLESGVSAPEIMDQQCRFVQPLQLQTEYPYMYFSENMKVCSELFFIIGGWNKSGLVSYVLVLLVWGSMYNICKSGFCLSTAV